MPTLERDLGKLARMNESYPAAGIRVEAGSVLITDDVACINCGYNLNGFSVDAVCPECGKPVADSVARDLFRDAPAEYVRSLYSGTKLVVGMILLLVVLALTSGVVSGLAGAQAITPAVHDAVAVGTSVCGVICSLLLTIGWWKLTEPNPEHPPEYSGGASRSLVRWMAVIHAAFSATQSIILLATGAYSFSATQNAQLSIGTGSLLAVVGLSLLGLVVFAVGYFAQMLYIGWMGPRLPNTWVTKRAKLMMWLGPLLYVVGALCIGLGPLVALILYYNLITKVRADLKEILRNMAEA